jgi:hypothetical protein
MQEDDALEFGGMLARANGTALIVAGEVSALAGAVRRGAGDYLRHLAGTGAARRGYFGGSDMDLDSELAGEGIGEAFEREFAGAMERGERRVEEIRAEVGFDRDAGEVDFEVLLDFFTRNLRGK